MSEGVRADGVPQSGTFSGRVDRGPGPLAGDPASAQVEKQRRGSLASHGHGRAGPNRVGRDRLTCVAPQGNHPLLVPLADKTHRTRAPIDILQAGITAARVTEVDVVQVQSGDLADPRAGAVEHLEHGAIAQGSG